MRSRILPTLYSIVHGPKNNHKKKAQKDQKCNLHAKQKNQTEISISLKCGDMRTITDLQNFHTTELNFNIRHHYFVSRKG